MIGCWFCLALLAPPAWTGGWPRYTALVWQYRTPPPGEALARALALSGFGGIHLDNGVPDGLLSFAKDHGTPFYVDHAAGKGDLYLKPGEWQEFAKQYKQTRGLAERPNSLSDPATFARLQQRLEQNIPRARTGPVLAYAFDDEISTTSFTSPADVDWSPYARAEFARWLPIAYGTLAALNESWGTSYTAWDQAEPLPTDALRPCHGQPFPAWNLARWADHREFMDASFADLLARLTAVANELDPAHPAGFVGGQAPAAYGGYDYGRLTEAVQFMEAYDLGATNELLRSLFGPDKPHVQTFFASQDPVQDRWFLWYYFAHGNRGLIAWPAWGEQSWFAADGTPDPRVAALQPTLTELQGDLAPLLVGAAYGPAQVALYYSQPSLRVSWFMDIEPHGGSWVNRSSSLNNDNASDLWNRWAWVKLLEDLQIPYDFVTDRQVAAQGLDPGRYRAVILGRTLALSDAEAGSLQRYAAAGGMVLADYLPGVFDGHGKGRPTGALDELFGVARDPAVGVLDGRTVAEVNGELYQQPLAERLSYDGALRWQSDVLYERGLRATSGVAEGQAGGSATMVRHGRAAYLNLTPVPYVTARHHADGDRWRDRVGRLLASADVQPLAQVQVAGRPAVGVELLRWQAPGEVVYAVVANPLRQASIDGPGRMAVQLSAQPVELRLDFGRMVHGLRNLRTRQSFGDVTAVTDAWVSCEANLYAAQD